MSIKNPEKGSQYRWVEHVKFNLMKMLFPVKYASKMVSKSMIKFIKEMQSRPLTEEQKRKAAIRLKVKVRYGVELEDKDIELEKNGAAILTWPTPVRFIKIEQMENLRG